MPYQSISRFLSWTFLALCANSNANLPEYQSFIKAIDAPSLNPRYGYMLINVDANGTAPSFDFVRLKPSSQCWLDNDKKPIVKGKPKHINLRGLTSDFYVYRLTPGLYQITQVNAPYFDLPFQKEIGFAPEWRFCIEKGKTNYVGKLFIDKERSTDYVDIRFINRFGTDKNYIESTYPRLLEDAPLRSGNGVRDDFYDFITSAKEGQ